MSFAKRINVFAAPLLVALAGVGATLSFLQIERLESKPTTLIESLPTGKQNFIILRNAKCVGTLSSNVNQDHSGRLEANIQAKLQIVSRGQLGQAVLTAQAYFDTDGQLYKSSWNLSAAGINVSVKSNGADPILVETLITTPQKQLTPKMKLPGPVIMLPNSDGTKRCLFTPASTSHFRVIDYTIAYLLEQFHIIGCSSLPDERTCQAEGQELDLSPFMNLLDKKRQKSWRISKYL